MHRVEPALRRTSYLPRAGCLPLLFCLRHRVAMAVPRGWAAVCVTVCPAVTQSLVPPHRQPLRGVGRDAGPCAAPSPPAADPLRSAHPLPIVLGFQLAILTQGPHRSRAGRRARPPSLGRFPAQLRGEGAQEAGGSCGFGRDGGFSAGSCQLEAISRAERASLLRATHAGGPAGTQPAVPASTWARRGTAEMPLCCLANIPLTPETQRDQERRIRREIANSNERRRMQSINAGFQSLKTLIPHTDGEKLSKAAILQQTAEYIFSLEQEKTRLLQQNTQLKRFIQEFSGSSPKRRRAEDKDEGIGSPDIWEDEKAEDLRREMIELRQQLDKERSVRMMLEEQVRSLEAHMYPEKLKVIAQQVQLQQQQEQVRLLHQEKLEREQQIRTQLLPAHGPPAPTHHPTVIVPAPPPSHHVTVVTMGPSSVINTVSTSRQNLDTIVQAIQHIEGTQEKQLQEEEQRRAVIVTPARACPEPSASDTASDTEGNDSDSMDQSKEDPLGEGELP
ncbi:transcription factor AP-4 isoform X1 [Phasianus colchicus]|nr:transcription factor AP-4 isoform X1 [Phasianus colchicus]